uniref:Uncharacterized protein n=1 Tax=Clytia hemisphaerica TaxID=252671 RepID=A0A7M5XGV9_9CNID
SNDFDKAEFIIPLLVNGPQDFERESIPTEPPQHNTMFTVDRRKISLLSSKADGTGAYHKWGNNKKLYYFDGLACFYAHKEENGNVYINTRQNPASTWQKKYVDKNCIYKLIRHYRYNKNNDFTHLIVELEKDGNMLDFYYVLYRWKNGVEKFIESPHGNTKNPLLGNYARKDPQALREVEENLKSGKSCEQVYFQHNKENEEPNSILSLKSITNLRYSMNKDDGMMSELDILKRAVRRKNNFVKSVNISDDRYTAFLYLDYMMSDIERFCVEGNSIFCIDTTFNIVPGLWLTDTSYHNLALVDLKGNHPSFPGPMMLHFRKDEPQFRCFGLEIIKEYPELSLIKKIGHDLDKATVNGMKSVFTTAENLWCTQHLQERTEFKLTKMGANQRIQNNVMADLYGAQDYYLHKDGLADADDAE